MWQYLRLPCSQFSEKSHKAASESIRQNHSSEESCVSQEQACLGIPPLLSHWQGTAWGKPLGTSNNVNFKPFWIIWQVNSLQLKIWGASGRILMVTLVTLTVQCPLQSESSWVKLLNFKCVPLTINIKWPLIYRCYQHLLLSSWTQFQFALLSA